MANAKTPWEVLSKIDCSKHTESKNGLTYLSWAWAWGMLKEHYPLAKMEKHWFMRPVATDEGWTNVSLPYCLDTSGNAYVQVSVAVPYTPEDAVSHSEILPVIDYRNKSVQNPDSMAVNTALQRCLAKAIAGLGLGHYIYAGEDIPQQDDSAPAPKSPPKKKPAAKKAPAKPAPKGDAHEGGISVTDPEFKDWFGGLPRQPESEEKHAACKAAGFKYEVLAGGESITDEQWSKFKVEMETILKGDEGEG